MFSVGVLPSSTPFKMTSIRSIQRPQDKSDWSKPLPSFESSPISWSAWRYPAAYPSTYRRRNLFLSIRTKWNIRNAVNRPHRIVIRIAIESPPLSPRWSFGQGDRGCSLVGCACLSPPVQNFHRPAGAASFLLSGAHPRPNFYAK